MIHTSNFPKLIMIAFYNYLKFGKKGKFSPKKWNTTFLPNPPQEPFVYEWNNDIETNYVTAVPISV